MKTKNKIITVIIVIALLITSVSVTAAIQNKKLTELDAAYASELEKAQSALERSQTDLASAQTQLQLLEEERLNNREILTGLITKVDYKDEPVYVIGHKTPDSDTVASAIGMAYLLNSLGISAEARIAGDLNLEGEFAFSELGYPAPEIMEDAAGKQLWLVDHSTDLQMVKGAEDARIVGIIDHHGIGSAENSEPINVLCCPAGSTCSVVCKLCEACGVELPEGIASVLLVGVLSDTANMKGQQVTKLDESAYVKLKTLSGITDTDGLFNGMLEAKLSFKGMDDREIFYSDYKDYAYNGFRYGIGNVKVARADLIPAMADRMQNVIKAEMENGCEAEFLLYHIYDPDYSTGYTGIVGKDMTFVDELMEGAFGEIAEMDGEYYVFRPSLSRKKDIVPPIESYLDTVK